MRNAIIAVAMVLLIVIGGYFLLRSAPKKEEAPVPAVSEPREAPEPAAIAPPMMHRVVRLDLKTQNRSGESGTAEIYDENGKVKVVIALTGAPRTAQPAHIHVGACPNPGAVKYPLANVINGTSTTMLTVPLDEIMNGLPLAVNVHKSAKELKTYVACGDILSSMMMEEPMGGSIMPASPAGGPVPGSNVPEMEVTPGGAMMTAPVNIEIKDFSFGPKEVRIKVGTKVIWTNRDSVGHTATSDTGVFDSPLLANGRAFEFTFTQKGTFEYHCLPHPNMVGKVVVE